jgi:phage terminase small subunit
MSDDDSTRWGPAMAELTEKQRQYVLAMASDPLGTATSWAKAAGYADDGSSMVRVTAHRLSHDPRIKTAVYECARSTIDSIGPMLGIAVMLKIARDNTHPKQLAAAIALANRSGFHETTEHVMHVQHTDRTGAAMIERIKELAGELGLDAARLLGANAPEKPQPEMKVIEHKENEDAGARSREESGAGEAGAGVAHADARPAADREDA